jgi:hypothetical protein
MFWAADDYSEDFEDAIQLSPGAMQEYVRELRRFDRREGEKGFRYQVVKANR